MLPSLQQVHHHLCYCDVETDCPQADGDKPAGDWATSHDSVHDVLVNKKSNAMLVFILFSTEETLVSFLLLLFRQSSSISFHRVQRRQGGQKKRWEDNIREWTSLEFGKSQRAVENREKWRKLVAKSPVVPQRPSRLRD